MGVYDIRVVEWFFEFVVEDGDDEAGNKTTENSWEWVGVECGSGGVGDSSLKM